MKASVSCSVTDFHVVKPCLIKHVLNVKKILAVINATYAVAKRKPEKIRLAAVQIYEFHIFIISSSSFPGILRTNLMTSSQLAC